MDFDLHFFASIAVAVIILRAIADVISMFKKDPVQTVEVPCITINLHSDDAKTMYRIADRLRETVREQMSSCAFDAAIREDPIPHKDLSQAGIHEVRAREVK